MARINIDRVLDRMNIDDTADRSQPRRRNNNSRGRKLTRADWQRINHLVRPDANLVENADQAKAESDKCHKTLADLKAGVGGPALDDQDSLVRKVVGWRGAWRRIERRLRQDFGQTETRTVPAQALAKKAEKREASRKLRQQMKGTKKG